MTLKLHLAETSIQWYTSKGDYSLQQSNKIILMLRLNLSMTTHMDPRSEITNEPSWLLNTHTWKFLMWYRVQSLFF